MLLNPQVPSSRIMGCFRSIGCWLAIVLLPCVMLFPYHIDFYYDWCNHTWIVGYCGEYFRTHGEMPVVLNTPTIGGMTHMVFYGNLLYHGLGLFAAFIDPEIVVRVAAIAAMALQFLVVRRAAVQLTARSGMATAIACLVTWAIYPLTNLYNRAALTEFFAGALLTCAICEWFVFLAAETKLTTLRSALLVGLYGTLAAGIHPITALIGGVFAVALLILFRLSDRAVAWKFRVQALAAAGALAVVVLLPWLYAVGRYRSRLNIGKPENATAFFDGVVLELKDSIDWWVTRLFPVPFDSRTLENEAEVSTPFLDAQLNLSLLIVAGAFVWLAWRVLRNSQWRRDAVWLAVPVTLTVFCLAMSMFSGLYNWLPFFKNVQFMYRFIGHANNAALVTIFAAMLVAARRRNSLASGINLEPSAVLICFALTLSGAGVIDKLVHATVGHMDWDRSLVTLPKTFYSKHDYVMATYYPPMTAPEEEVHRLPFPYDPLADFGRYQPLTVELEKPGYVVPQVVPFVWNRFYLDGQLIPIRSALVRDSFGFGLAVPAGKHVIEHRFEPDQTWRVLQIASRVALGIWLTIALVCFVGWIRDSMGLARSAMVARGTH